MQYNNMKSESELYVGKNKNTKFVEHKGGNHGK